MPGVQIRTNTSQYQELSERERLDIATDICGTIVGELDLLEESESVAVSWTAPFEGASSMNEVDFTVEIEFSKRYKKKHIKSLARTVAQELSRYTCVPAGSSIGVWIKTPYRYYWYQTQKSTEDPS